MKVRKLATTVRGRRNQLKRFLRENARLYNMNDWFEVPDCLFERPNEEFEKFFNTRNKLMENLRKRDRKASLKAFEECGSSCCIGGAARLLASVYDLEEVIELFGIKPKSYTKSDSSLFYIQYWPLELREEYLKARGKNDYVGMVEAGIKAIDHFAAE